MEKSNFVTALYILQLSLQDTP